MNKEIIKKCKKLGYEWEKDTHIVYLSNSDFNDERRFPEWTLVIEIDTKNKTYEKYWGNNVQEPITLEDHKLLSEIFEMLEVEKMSKPKLNEPDVETTTTGGYSTPLSEYYQQMAYNPNAIPKYAQITNQDLFIIIKIYI